MQCNIMQCNVCVCVCVSSSADLDNLSARKSNCLKPEAENCVTFK